MAGLPLHGLAIQSCGVQGQVIIADDIGPGGLQDHCILAGSQGLVVLPRVAINVAARQQVVRVAAGGRLQRQGAVQGPGRLARVGQRHAQSHGEGGLAGKTACAFAVQPQGGFPLAGVLVGARGRLQHIGRQGLPVRQRPVDLQHFLGLAGPGMDAHQIILRAQVCRVLPLILPQAVDGGLVLALPGLAYPVLVGGGLRADAARSQHQHGEGIQPEPARRRGSGWK